MTFFMFSNTTMVQIRKQVLSRQKSQDGIFNAVNLFPAQAGGSISTSVFCLLGNTHRENPQTDHLSPVFTVALQPNANRMTAPLAGRLPMPPPVFFNLRE